jgi:hypothetical protein
MSDIGPGSVGTTTDTSGTSGTLGVVTGRNIGGMIAQVTVSEEHQDDLEITQHPIEMGAEITDHSFKRPSVVTIRAGWSDSNPAGTDVKDVYQQFLTLQKSRRPISIVTGKRNYANMLIRSCSIGTDQTTENALIVTAICQEIILVSTSTVSVPPNTSQSSPQQTGGVQNQGSVQPVPAAPNTGPNSGAFGQALSV